MSLSLSDLRERQHWSLSQKVQHSMDVISSFVDRAGGLDKVYVSLSGGKDSTVLLDIARRIYPDIKAVFCSTGNEYPDIVRFVRSLIKEGANIEIIRPAMTPREIWAKYGFPLISKETAQRTHEIRRNPDSPTCKKYLTKETFGFPKKWRWLIDAKFDTSHMCCTKLKKEPFHKYERETGRLPILGIMASESQLREKLYLKGGGCNIFAEKGRCKSMPLSIWLEEDIWEYIHKFNVRIAEIYHKGATRTGCAGCAFGSTFPDDPRFKVLLANYPKLYDMVMGYTNHGVTFREALREVLAVNGLYLPDERPADLFSVSGVEV